MESKSTYVRAGLGGFQEGRFKGRRVIARQPDAVVGSDVQKACRPWRWLRLWGSEVGCRPQIFSPVKKNPVIRVIKGDQFACFTSSSQERFFADTFRVTAKSDRMGYRLQGEALELTQPLEMISEAVSFGTIQVPPDGNPIVLLADRQTAGGYPRIAHIVSADFSQVTQMMPGEQVQFQLVSLQEAERIYIERETKISELSARLKLEYML